jgi:Domain of unknown function (DUF1902)
MNQPIYKIEAFWDSDAEVWVATSGDIWGLATEADTLESLTQKLRTMIPELIELNHCISPESVGSITFELISHRQELIKMVS